MTSQGHLSVTVMKYGTLVQIIQDWKNWCWSEREAREFIGWSTREPRDFMWDSKWSTSENFSWTPSEHREYFKRTAREQRENLFEAVRICQWTRGEHEKMNAWSREELDRIYRMNSLWFWSEKQFRRRNLYFSSGSRRHSSIVRNRYHDRMFYRVNMWILNY